MCLQLGDVVYEVEGKGLPPQKEEPVTPIAAAINESTTKTLLFSNPLCMTVSVRLRLVNKGSCEGHFCILLPGDQSFRLPANSVLRIPVAFNPVDMGMESAEVVVQAMSSQLDEDLLWHYPLQGIPVLPLITTTPSLLSCTARQRKQWRVEVALPGTAADEPQPLPDSSSKKSDDSSQQSRPSVDGSQLLFRLQPLTDGDDATRRVIHQNIGLSLLDSTPGKDGNLQLCFDIVFAPNSPSR